MSLLEKFKSKLDMINKGSELCPEHIKHLNNFYSFLVENKEHSYFTPPKVKIAAKCSTFKEALAVIEFLSLGEERLATLSFIYHGYDDEEDIEVDYDIYYEYINDGLTPVNASSGAEIEFFEPDLLSFQSFIRVT